MSEESGVDGQIGHIAFPTYGRDNGITHVEVFPYLTDDDHLFFGNARGFVTNEFNVGINLGAGFRFIEPAGIAVLGISGWYDADQSTGKFFHQIGLNLEAWTEYGGITSNLYWPVSNGAQQLDRTLSNQRFEGNQILLDVKDTLGDAMQGADMIASLFVPGEFAEDHNIQFSGGFYAFQGDNADDIFGYKLALSGDVTPSIKAQVAFTNDDTFGSNTTIGAAWRFGTKDNTSRWLRKHLRRPVERNYNVIVSERAVFQDSVAAINPDTNSAYVVQHVGGASVNSNGTPEQPWATVSEAQAAGADLIFVQSGTTVSESVVLSDGQSLLGEGLKYKLTSKGHGRFTLPTATGGTDLPTISNAPGDAVTLANGSQFGGFNIVSPSGAAIVADSIDDFQIWDVTIDMPGGDGIFVNSSTEGTIERIVIENAISSGIRIVDIDDVLNVEDITIDTTGEYGVLIEGGYGEVNFAGELNITDTTIAGFAVYDLETLVEITEDDDGEETEEETPGIVAVEELTITSSTGIGVQVEDSDGYVVFEDLNVDLTNGTALWIRDSAEIVSNDGILVATNAPVIDIAGSEVALRLTSASADGGEAGVRVTSSTGDLFVYGQDDYSTGGTIQNVDVGLEIDGFERTGFQGVDFTNNEVNGEIANVESLALWYLQVTGTSEQLFSFTNVEAMELAGSKIEENPISSDVAIEYAVDTEGAYLANFLQNIVSDTPGTILKVTNEGLIDESSLSFDFSSNEVTLDSSQAIAASVEWTGTMDSRMGSNYIVGDESTQTAFNITANESADLASVIISQNSIGFEGPNSSAIKFFGDAPSLLEVTANVIEFAGQNGTGIHATFAEQTGTVISSNQIYDSAGGATAILFPAVSDGSTLSIDGNHIDLSEFNSFVDRGFILSTITGDDPSIQINSTTQNTILGASTPYFLPTTGWVGQLLVTETQ